MASSGSRCDFLSAASSPSASPEDLLREAVRHGTKTLNALGAEMAARGETSLEEVLRVAPAV